MSASAVERPIEREYRNLVSDNRRSERLSLRPRDIVVCTPPKCGTTWMQTIVATLLFPDGGMPGPVTEVAPWIEARLDPIDDVIASLEGQTHRRSVKTHTPADGIPWAPSAFYIVVGRDGRDGPGPPPLDDVHRFSAWWLNDSPLWFEHVASFWKHRGEPNVLFVHYNDMQADLDAHFVGGADAFLYKGTNGRWRGILTVEELGAFDRRSRELLDPLAARWTAIGAAAFTEG